MTASEKPDPRSENAYPVSWDKLHSDTRLLATMLKRINDATPENLRWHAMICVTRGGLVPAGIVARELNIRAIENICLELYDYQVIHEEIVVRKGIGREFLEDYGEHRGKRILVIDDLVDTGKTARFVRSRLPPDIHYATVYSKPAGELAVNTKVLQVSQDKWVYFPWDMGYNFQPPMADDSASAAGTQIRAD